MSNSFNEANENTIKAIVFDLGGVLVEVSQDRGMAPLIELTGLSPDELSSRFSERPIAGEYEQGKISTDEFLEISAEALNLENGEEKIREVFMEIIREPVLSIDLLQQLRKNYDLYMLSNTNPIHFGKVVRDNPLLLAMFKKIFLSYELKLMKPDPSVFKRLLLETRLKPEEILVIDDNPENVEAAQKAGMHAIKFMGEDNLREKLESMGIA